MKKPKKEPLTLEAGKSSESSPVFVVLVRRLCCRVHIYCGGGGGGGGGKILIKNLK